jgi:cysteine desulfurase
MTTAHIYLDHAATTPMRAEVLDAMLPLLTEEFGNPSSVHAYGRRARAALDEAHEELAQAINAEPRELVFTSGGTEAVNLAVKGAAWAGKASGARIVTSAVEHRAVLFACRHLEKFGFEPVLLPVDRYGRIDPDDLTGALNDKTIVVSLQLANNEVGTIQPMVDLVARVRAATRALVHVDAVQAAGSLPIDVEALGADLVSLAGHKVEGPKGIGALWLRRGTAILPQQHGGSQERHRRAGTENVAGAVGMARAFSLAVQERPTVTPRVTGLRDRLRDAVLEEPGIEVTGHPRMRLPGHLSVIVRDLAGADLVVALDLDGVCVSTGSACSTASPEASHVLTAMGYPDEEALGSLRLSLGRTTTAQQVESAAAIVRRRIAAMRAAGPALRAQLLGEEALA